MIKTEDELSVTMGKYKPGYYFGWSALQPAQRYQHRALCIMDCEVGFISGETLRSIMEREPALSFPLMRNILAMHKDRLDLRTDQLIKAITGREVPSGGLPMDIGVVVQNVGTTAAIADAVLRGTPLIERVCTVTGAAVREPKNLRIRIGMPVAHLVEACGGIDEDPGKIILGGPMMGIAQVDLAIPATRGTSGVLLLREQDLPLRQEGPCIRCARCVQGCPANLLPTTIAAYGRLDRMEEAEDYRALDCIECGCCSFSCPAAIPLVQTIRYAKAAIMARKRSG